jgi:hypothetical protein
MEIKKLKDLKSQKGYQFNEQYFVAYEGNSQFDATNQDYLACLKFIKNGGKLEPEFTQEEYLKRAKDNKIAELNNYYNSDECWLFRLKSTTLKASLTKTADFFSKVLPAIDSSFPVYFETDDKKIISTNLTSEKAKKINAKIQLEISIYIKKLRIETELKINNCKSAEEIVLIDVKKALGVVPREIEIDNI